MSPHTSIRRLPGILPTNDLAALRPGFEPAQAFAPSMEHISPDLFEAATAPTSSVRLTPQDKELLGQHHLLMPGARGPEVCDLQARLGIAQTGEFDDATKTAVAAYQKEKGLREDGQVGQESWASLLGIPLAAIRKVAPGTWLLAADIVTTVESYRNRGQLAQMMLGTITVNGHTYRYRNGGHNRGSAPLGDYIVEPHLWTRDEPAFSVDGVGWSMAVSDKYDPRVKDVRSLLRIHPDGASEGTSGCFGIVGNGAVQTQFREDMRELFRQRGDAVMMRVG